MTRATAMTLIASIDMRTMIMMMTRLMAILPTDNNDVDDCREHWSGIGNSCYYMTGETSSTLNDAQNKCKKISAKLPIIKSESENTFIHGLMSAKKSWIWLGMRRKQRRMVWSDGTPAESPDGALYSAWNKGEPSSGVDENCAYLNFHDRGWNDNKCHYTASSVPYVLCQEERNKNGSSKTYTKD
ncbi:PREDICTED: C-type lectin domain family 4 member M-like [Acropora digitifera]|uniref:C-type lectin domain family 4 member M-like n=1 Tax=Acropora digitifera TaxID=70779 RepID=UPI00077B0DD2|nr:PREDICTED: C-type lectin domain family 4 member M-like [Acropora digitifera]